MRSCVTLVALLRTEVSSASTLSTLLSKCCWFLGARNDLKRPAMVRLRRWVVPNIGRQLILERCVHGVAEQFHRRIRPEGNSALHDQPLLVVHDDLQALDLVALHGPLPAQEG